MQGKNFKKIKFFAENLKRGLSISAKQVCAKCLKPCKVLLRPTGTECRVIVIMSFCLSTFYVIGEVFKMNDYMSTSEMKTVLDSKGGMIQ
jgi:hypothetical protein